MSGRPHLSPECRCVACVDYDARPAERVDFVAGEVVSLPAGPVPLQQDEIHSPEPAPVFRSWRVTAFGRRVAVWGKR